MNVGEKERKKEGKREPLYNNANTRQTARQRERERIPTVERRGDSLDTAELVSGVSLLI